MSTRIDQLKEMLDNGGPPVDRIGSLRALAQLHDVDPALSQGFLDYAAGFSNESHQAPVISEKSQGESKVRPETIGRAAFDFVPVVGELLAVRDAINFAREGHEGLALLSAAGVLPFVPDQLGKMGQKAPDIIDKLKGTKTIKEFDQILAEEIGDAIPFKRPPGSSSHSAETILRLQRAQEQGFDIANPMFHATPADVDFDRFYDPIEAAANSADFGIHAGTAASSRQKVGYNLQREVKEIARTRNVKPGTPTKKFRVDDHVRVDDLPGVGIVSGKVKAVQPDGTILVEDNITRLPVYVKPNEVTASTSYPREELVKLTGAKPSTGKAGVRTIPVFLKRGKRAFLPDPGTWADPDATYHVLKSALGDAPPASDINIRNMHAAAAQIDPNVGKLDWDLMDHLAEEADRVRENVAFKDRTKEWHKTFRATLKEHGYDSVDYLNETEDAGSISSFVLDPQQVRSVFAKFDPSKVDSPDLSAAIAGLLGLQVARQVGKERDDGN